MVKLHEVIEDEELNLIELLCFPIRVSEGSIESADSNRARE
jgi:hypothetical protein